MYNQILFGLKVSDFLNSDVVVPAETAGCYEWILIDEGHLYLTDEKDIHNIGLSLDFNSKKEIDLSKVLQLFPDKDYVEMHNSIDIIDQYYYSKEAYKKILI